jgi:diaminohydroxyphosphoribosylaminopyrimidine deaminase/5-amino-6-(5-phosphoribosylamino)uracil reductase
VVLACSKEAVRRSRKAACLERQGCEILPLPSRNGFVSLEALLKELGRRKMTNLLVEGGGAVLGSGFARHLADEARVFVSPALIGGRGAPAALDGVGCKDWPPMSEGSPVVRRIGRDLLYVIQPAGS